MEIELYVKFCKTENKNDEFGRKNRKIFRTPGFEIKFWRNFGKYKSHM